MDFSDLLDGLSWFGEKINEAIWGFLYTLASNLISEAFDYIVTYVIQDTDPDKFFNYSSYLTQMQSIALALLLVAIVWEGVKYQSGALGEETTLQSLIIRCLFAAVCIFFLPYSLENFFIKISNYLVKMVTANGIELTNGGLLGNLINPNKLSTLVIIMLLILAISFLILSFVAAMRYVEIIIITMIAPLAAVSIVRDNELLEVWIRETIAVVFTQPLQVFVLAFMLNALGKVNTEGVEAYFIAVAALVVMIQGPQVLRKFVYNTGTGSSSVKAVGSAGRMAVYKAIGRGAFR